jgi:hypothetical protein
MPRSISSGLQTQIANDANKIAFLIEFNFSTPLRVTDYYADVTYESNSYQAGGDFVSIEPSNETGEAKSEEIVITMSNITSSVRSLIEDGNYTDKTVNIYIAFFDTSESLVDATTFFSGTINNATVIESSGDSTVSISVANHWANWNLKKGRHFSDESQQNIYSGDKGLEYADQTKEDIRWGSD